jgi:transcriptional regulator with XRE-family HTH domain
VAQETAGKDGRTSRTDAVDAHVGQRIRARRVVMGFSQEKLANALGLTFQQVQKYEKGANRVGASRLFDLARVLEVPVAYFFDGLPSARPDNAADIPGWPMAEAGLKRETLDLLRAYNSISDPVVRRRVFDLARTLAETDPGPRH